MELYQKPYLILFNGVTDALEALERLDLGTARDLLQTAQQWAEEAYVSAGEPDKG